MAAPVRAAMPPLAQWRRFAYCEAVAGGRLWGEVDHFAGETRGEGGGEEGREREERG